VTRVRVGIVVLLVSALFAGATFVLYRFVYLPDVRHVAVPPDRAPPQDVVLAYLDAVDGHDCDTARAVVVPDSWHGFQRWCEDVHHVDDVTARTSFVEQTAIPAGRRSRVAKVTVTMSVGWRLFHGDPSMTGRITWSYRLVRDSRSAPWRIVSSGGAV
jgi:hypothetical protein